MHTHARTDQALLRSIADLQGPPLRLQRMRTLFLVLYCTGLRLGEASICALPTLI